MINFIKKYQILILISFGILLYFQSLSFNFVYDDTHYIVNNEYINGRTNLNLSDFFVPKFVRDDVYIPFTFIVFWGVIKLFGLSSSALHFVNISFYILSSIALFYLLKKIIKNDLIAFFATCLYILHPSHIECTAWISAMGYNIAALFFFLSFLFFILAFDENKKLNYVYSVIFYILAILSQPIAVTLPAILFLWVYCYRREKLKESIKFISVYIPILFIYLFLFRQTVSNSYRFSNFIAHSFFDKLVSFGHYAFNAFLPINLNPFYVSSSPFYLIGTILVVIFLVFLFFKKDNKLDNNLLFFIGFYLITLFPYLGIVFDNMFLVADRYLLFASVSSCVFISIFSFYLLEKFKDKSLLKYGLFVVFIVLFFGSSFVYLPIWKDNESFWRYAYYNSYTKNIDILSSYGTILLNNGKYEEASVLADDIIEKYPKFSEGYITKIQATMALNDLKSSLKICNKFRENVPECVEVYLYYFDICMILQDFDNASKYLDYAYNKAKEYNLYKNDKIVLFAEKRLILSYVNADPDNYIKNLQIISNDFKLLQDHGEFSNIKNKDDYQSREEACLNYLKNYNTQYSQSITNLLSCLYVHDKYKENSSKVMQSILRDMNKAGEFLNKGDSSSSEKIYLDVISKNKYMIEAYYNLGVLYFNMNKQEKAREIFAKLLEINPNDEQAKQFLR